VCSLSTSATPIQRALRLDELLEVLSGLSPANYQPVRVITFHTRTTAKFYGDDYAVESTAAVPEGSNE
jgi:hypothetical protein